MRLRFPEHIVSVAGVDELQALAICEAGESRAEQVGPEVTWKPSVPGAGHPLMGPSQPLSFRADKTVMLGLTRVNRHLGQEN
jgi:hypothetical protein